jgi:CBS domain-containing protein
MSATLGDVASEIRGAALSTCVVLDDNGVVHGRLRPRELNGDPTGTVESVMELGPTTVRADEPLPDLLDRMARRNVTEVLVTNPEGQLLGIVTREKT